MSFDGKSKEGPSGQRRKKSRKRRDQPRSERKAQIGPGSSSFLLMTLANLCIILYILVVFAVSLHYRGVMLICFGHPFEVSRFCLKKIGRTQARAAVFLVTPDALGKA